jgi:hypothetical protein
VGAVGEGANVDWFVDGPFCLAEHLKCFAYMSTSILCNQMCVCVCMETRTRSLFLSLSLRFPFTLTLTLTLVPNHLITHTRTHKLHHRMTFLPGEGRGVR